MRTIWTIAKLTFLKLRRDRIQVAAIVGGLGLIAFATLASQWALEDVLKIFFDFATFGCHVVGAGVALFWGTKMVADARRDGSLEIHLAAPVGRGAWIIGNFLGLSFALLLLALILLPFWQVALFSLSFGWMTSQQLMVFPLLVLGWMVMGALAIFFASFTSAAVALFCGSCLWVAGLVSFPVARALGAETPETTRKLVEGIAMVWNLKQFQMGEIITTPLSVEEWAHHCLHGLALALFLVALASLLFRNRDVAS